MKKLVILSLIVLAGTSAVAQLKPLSLGVHGGWNYNKIYVTDFHSRTHWGYSAGLFARVNLSRFYIEPAVDYTHREVVIERSVGDTKLRSSAIDVPVLFGINYLSFPLVKARFFVGPVASFLFKPMKYEDNYGPNQATPVLRTSEKTMIHVRGGLGVDVWRATFDVSYQVGVKKFGETLSTPQGLNFTVGLKFF
jgi:hypothetical protein